MPRIVVLGCGTGVGKTRLSVALLRGLAGPERGTVGLKPVESGLEAHADECTPDGSDAAALAQAATLRVLARHPLYGLRKPVSPHLAARLQGVTIDLGSVARWVNGIERRATTDAAPHSVIWSVIESAGGVFSPLSSAADNFALAQVLEPAIWILVAADALGVLHDVSATLQAMRARGRTPDHVVLSAARDADASTGGNAAELRTLGIATPAAVLGRHEEPEISLLLSLLLREKH